MRRDAAAIGPNAAGRRVYYMNDNDFPCWAGSREVGYFRPTEEAANLVGNLPHWRQDGVTYFVTFRLADSLPQAKLDEWVRERDASAPRPSETVG